MNEKATFVFGFVSGVALCSVIGVIILFFTMNNQPATVAVAPTNNPAPSEQPKQVEPNIAITGDEYILGNPNAPVVIVEYSDIDCPFCARVHPTLKQVVEESDGQIAWIYKHFPLESIHPNANRAAQAAECAASIGNGNDTFWPYLDELFENQGNLNDTTYRRVAANNGVDADALIACLDAGTFAGKVADHTQEAVANGGTGTPFSILVSDSRQVPVSGALPKEAFEQIATEIAN